MDIHCILRLLAFMVLCLHSLHELLSSRGSGGAVRYVCATAMLLAGVAGIYHVLTDGAQHLPRAVLTTLLAALAVSCLRDWFIERRTE
ncbi:hypothetical protein APX81_11010 [Escherichia coli]|nr:hypothetical protein [Escherichia coli]EAC1400291.1 hypothetical protein [Escherichia coli]PAZ25201.1 hypothetical protein APU33_13150 [Escherichia coli]PAZ32285.1 hypothetical protein APU34_02395 [Escherichia coli]PAZ33898.1 hypothetical protein APU35_22220 [Escherichia coli]PAZ40985.1 hypothetical protein APU36_07400 [Escherichia coli]